MNDLAGALCVGKHALFESTHPTDHQEAAALCRQCPVRLACAALLHAEKTAGRRACTSPVGTWAGTLVGGSRSLPRACGTERGYYQHAYRGEETCSACRKAHAAAMRGTDHHRRKVS